MSIRCATCPSDPLHIYHLHIIQITFIRPVTSSRDQPHVLHYMFVKTVTSPLGHLQVYQTVQMSNRPATCPPEQLYVKQIHFMSIKSSLCPPNQPACLIGLPHTHQASHIPIRPPTCLVRLGGLG